MCVILVCVIYDTYFPVEPKQVLVSSISFVEDVGIDKAHLKPMEDQFFIPLERLAASIEWLDELKHITQGNLEIYGFNNIENIIILRTETLTADMKHIGFPVISISSRMSNISNCYKDYGSANSFISGVLAKRGLE